MSTSDIRVIQSFSDFLWTLSSLTIWGFQRKCMFGSSIDIRELQIEVKVLTRLQKWEKNLIDQN